MTEPAGKRARFPANLASLGSRTASPAQLSRPQRPLMEAARDAARRAPSTGHGLDSDGVRARMVTRLRADGIDDESVLAAFLAVPRHRFVDSALATQAYEDTSLPIGWGQTISKPSVVARMLALVASGARAAGRQGLGRVLEIGTGCGYQTALLACLSTHVVSIERLKALHERASLHLADRRSGDRIRLVWGDGMLGHAPRAPYDSIVAAAGGEGLPQAWLDQLAVGGRLVAPVHAPSGGAQQLLVVDRTAGGFERQRHEAVLFVPLKSGLG